MNPVSYIVVFTAACNYSSHLAPRCSYGERLHVGGCWPCRSSICELRGAAGTLQCSLLLFELSALSPFMLLCNLIAHIFFDSVDVTYHRSTYVFVLRCTRSLLLDFFVCFYFSAAMLASFSFSLACGSLFACPRVVFFVVGRWCRLNKSGNIM